MVGRPFFGVFIVPRLALVYCWQARVAFGLLWVLFWFCFVHARCV
jgi:hypothetical protein